MATVGSLNGGLNFAIKAEMKRIGKQLTATEREAIPKAAAEAMNRTRDNARTRLVRYMQKFVGTQSQKPWRRRHLIRMDKRAKFNSLTTTMTFGTFQMAIGDYGELQESGSGVAVVTKASAYFFDGAFVQTMPDTGHENAFERWGSKKTIQSKPSSKKLGKSYKGQAIRKVSIDLTRPVETFGKRAVLLAFRNTFYKRIEQQMRRHLNRIWK